MEYTFYYELSKNQAVTYNYTTSKFKTMLMYDVYKLDRHYFLPIQYEPSKKGLKQFSVDFNIAVNKLKDNSIFKFDYTKYRSHESASVEMFKKLCHGKYDMDDIDQTEYEWIEACNNSGLNYCEPGKYGCHGYDYSSQYPSILASEQFQIATKKGIQKTITTLPDKLQVGFYKVRIISDDIRFKKVFGFSKKNVYTHTSIMFALMCKNKEGYNIDIELIQEQNNCYIYGSLKEDGITKGSNIFGKWFRYMFELKEQYPECKVLIKLITSSLWGRLAEFNRLFKTDEEIVEENLDVVTKYDRSHKYYIRSTKTNRKGDDLCELVNSRKPYYFNIARIKPFLLAQSRIMTAKVAIKYIDDVVRICTDNITFQKNHDDVVFQASTFKLTKEAKTTGEIEWKYTTCYYNHSTGYKTKHFDKNDDSDDDSDDE